MKTILTYGTFDLLHYGHINLLKRARDMGDYLIVGLSTDDFNRKKGKTSYFTYEERKQLLESIRFVDYVFPETDWEQKLTDIEKFNIDTMVMGDDWKGKFDYLSNHCNVTYLSRTPKISSTKIRTDLKLIEM